MRESNDRFRLGFHAVPRWLSPRLLLVLGVLWSGSPAFGLLPFPLTAGQRGTVSCLENPSVTYDVYLPPSYSIKGTALPILYTLNPNGGGYVSSFQTVCANLNVITIGITGSKNGASWDTVFREFYAVTRDIRQRVNFEPTGEFVGGFSGGAENSYMFSRFRAPHVAGVFSMGGWLGRINDFGARVNYYSTDRVQTNLLVARAVGTTDNNTIFYGPFDSNYLATCGAVIQDWSFSGGHTVPGDSVKSACLGWLLNQRRRAGINDQSNSVVQAAEWRSRLAAGQRESVLRDCVGTLMSEPRSWNAYQAQLVVDDLLTNYNALRPLTLDNLAQGDFASDLFYYAARGAGTNRDWQRYYSNLKALTGISTTNGTNGTRVISGINVTVILPTTNGSITITSTTQDRAGDVYALLGQYGYPAPVLQSSVVPASDGPGRMSVWLRKDTPGLGYSLEYRASILGGNWSSAGVPRVETDGLWSGAISLPPEPGWGFYRVETAPVPATSPPWP